MTESRTKVVVEISGGMIRKVYCSEPRVDVTIVDWDTEGCPPGSRYLQSINIDEQRTAEAFVYPLETTCPEALEDSETLTVLQAAGEAAWL